LIHLLPNFGSSTLIMWSEIGLVIKLVAK
jgi:hypothetical protein